MYQNLYAMKTIIETTSRKFRERQKDFFDLADKGQKIIIRRGSKQSYVLTPISADDLYFTPEMVQRIKESQKEILEGNYEKFDNVDSLDEFIRSL